MSNKIQRRYILKTAALSMVAIPAAGLLQKARAAAPLPLLDPNDATAKALGYVANATKVDAKANPTYKPGQHCGNCVQFQGKLTDKQAACPLFAGRDVLSAGWCKVWVQKPA
ncbi:MAG: high-potential iron-sulfur protein [Steroidobacteraceae bacterium]